MSPSLQQRMSQKTDEELYDILSHRKDYTPETIEVVEQELSKRNLKPPRISQLKAITKAKKRKEEMIARKPLQWPLRIILFLFPLGIPQFIAAEYFRNKGAERKYRECWRWMIYGVIFYVAIFVIRLIIELITLFRY